MKRFADVHLHMSTPEFDKCETFLNEIKAQRGFAKSVLGVGNLLNINRIKESIKLLDISCMPIPWKMFFYLCKKRLTILLTAMLYMMEYVRTHRRQQKNESETTPN